MLFAAERYKIVSATMFAYFQLGGHEPEIVISHRLRNLVGWRKELFYSFSTSETTHIGSGGALNSTHSLTHSAHNKSDDVNANSVRELVTRHTEH